MRFNDIFLVHICTKLYLWFKIFHINIYKSIKSHIDILACLSNKFSFIYKGFFFCSKKAVGNRATFIYIWMLRGWSSWISQPDCAQ